MKFVLFFVASTLMFVINAQAQSQGYDIIVVAGQSNAEGVGMGPTIDDTSRDAVIFQLGRVGNDNLKAVPAKDPLQSWSYPNNFVGFGLSFARAYAATLPTSRKVLLVPVAYGGSSILVWEKSQILYVDMKARIKAAQALPGENRVVAFLWHQSETDMLFIDAKNPGMPNAAVYGTKLQELVTNIRTDFPSQPLFPIIMGEPVPSWFKRKSARCKVIKEIKAVVKANPQNYFAGSQGLKSNLEDGVSKDSSQTVHFSARSQTLYGKKYFQVFAQRRSVDEQDEMFCF
jgi:hypothetical protein